MARAAAGEAGDALEDAFPGRWDARRRLHADLRPLAQAAARTLEEAGWWTPGSGAAVPGGLVLAVDLHGFGPGLTFTAALERAGRPPRPGGFLHALPSTPAATLGLLFGLPDYQATVAGGGLAGFHAVAHAVDRLRLGRLPRVLVGALSALAPAPARRLGREPFLHAAAWCLEPDPAAGDAAVAPAEVEDARLETADLLDDVPASARGLAAPSLLALDRALGGSRPAGGVIRHRDAEGRAAALWIGEVG